MEELKKSKLFSVSFCIPFSQNVENHTFLSYNHISCNFAPLLYTKFKSTFHKLNHYFIMLNYFLFDT